MKYKTKTLFGTSTFAFKSRATDTAYTCISIHLYRWLCIQNHFRVQLQCAVWNISRTQLDSMARGGNGMRGSVYAMHCNDKKIETNSKLRKVDLRQRHSDQMETKYYITCYNFSFESSNKWQHVQHGSSLLTTHPVQNNDVWNITPSNVHSNEFKLELHCEMNRGIEP